MDIVFICIDCGFMLFEEDVIEHNRKMRYEGGIIAQKIPNYEGMRRCSKCGGVMQREEY